MYTPHQFLLKDKKAVLSFMKAYSFATIVSLQQQIPVATHLPFVVEERDDKLVLISHFAKANNQAITIEKQKTLVIFSEPHAYVSPRHYESAMNVPTWNYVSVHVYGNVTLITDPKQMFETLNKMISSFETGYQQQWNQLPMNFKRKMLNGIVPFELVVTNIEAKNKLSQNRTETEQRNIIATLEQSEDSNEKQIALFMKQIKK